MCLPSSLFIIILVSPLLASFTTFSQLFRQGPAGDVDSNGIYKVSIIYYKTGTVLYFREKLLHIRSAMYLRVTASCRYCARALFFVSEGFQLAWVVWSGNLSECFRFFPLDPRLQTFLA